MNIKSNLIRWNYYVILILTICIRFKWIIFNTIIHLLYISELWLVSTYPPSEGWTPERSRVRSWAGDSNTRSWMPLVAVRLEPSPERGGRETFTDRTNRSVLGIISNTTTVSQLLRGAKTFLMRTTSPLSLSSSASRSRAQVIDVTFHGGAMSVLTGSAATSLPWVHRRWGDDVW